MGDLHNLLKLIGILGIGALLSGSKINYEGKKFLKPKVVIQEVVQSQLLLEKNTEPKEISYSERKQFFTDNHIHYIDSLEKRLADFYFYVESIVEETSAMIKAEERGKTGLYKVHYDVEQLYEKYSLALTMDIFYQVFNFLETNEKAEYDESKGTNGFTMTRFFKGKNYSIRAWIDSTNMPRKEDSLENSHRIAIEYSNKKDTRKSFMIILKLYNPKNGSEHIFPEACFTAGYNSVSDVEFTFPNLIRYEEMDAENEWKELSDKIFETFG